MYRRRRGSVYIACLVVVALVTLLRDPLSATHASISSKPFAVNNDRNVNNADGSQPQKHFGARALNALDEMATKPSPLLVDNFVATPPTTLTLSPSANANVGVNNIDTTPQNNRIPPNRMKAKYSYVVVISNLEYVDGAITMGWSFRKQSPLLQSGDAELTAIVSDTLKDTDIEERLKEVKWDNVIFVDDLKKFAPEAHWALTFNKIYMFQLTQFELVAFFDVDMLIVQNPDALFTDTVLPSAQWVGALGEDQTKKFPYFQTGMMVIKPDMKVFSDLAQDFLTNPEYRDINGRDGKLIRRYFRERYVRLDHGYSAHVRPGQDAEGVIGYHFPGGWKPWFNVEQPKEDVEQEMGEPYRLWWQTYEEIHREVYAHKPKTANWDPSRQMWLSRHSPKEYKQLLSEYQLEERKVTLPGMKVVVGKDEESCDQACDRKGLHCRDDALQTVVINTCEAMMTFFECNGCSVDFPHETQPSRVASGKCYANSLTSKLNRPTCAAARPNTRRLCTCVPEAFLSADFMKME